MILRIRNALAPAQHAPTPGPWRWMGNHLVAGAKGKHLGEFIEAPGLRFEAEANRRLIAGAPTVLAALKDVLPLAEAYLRLAPSHPDNAALVAARDAIKRTEG
jgi:hypothetical protein